MKWMLFFTLIVLSVGVLIPPLRYGYIYPTAGDDTASHIGYFTHMGLPVGDYYIGSLPIPSYPLYFGQYAVGWLLNLLPIDINVSFMWFNFAVLIMAVWAVGLSVGLSVSYFAGILASILVFGRSYLLTQFYWGILFDIVGIAILLPIMLLCLHNIQKGIGWKIGLGITTIIFAVFHVNGKYLFALIPIVVGYELVRYRLKLRKPKWAEFLARYRFLTYCGLFSGAMVSAFLLKISIDWSRIWLDATILLSMLIAGVVAILVGKNWKYRMAVLAMVLVVSYPQVAYWMNNNSAIKEADKNAISYLNSLDGESYYVSSEITRHIYYAYINKQQDEENPDYIVVRSIAMTETSAIKVKHSGEIILLDTNYELLRTFDYGEKERYTGEPIKVSVYAKAN